MTTPLATEKLQQTPEIVVRRSFLGLLSGLIVTSISAVLGLRLGVTQSSRRYRKLVKPAGLM